MPEDQQVSKKVRSKFDVKFKLIPETLESPFTELFLGYGEEGLVKSEPGGTVIPAVYGRHADKIFRFKPRNDDAWIVTFPKCVKKKFK